MMTKKSMLNFVQYIINYPCKDVNEMSAFWNQQSLLFLTELNQMIFKYSIKLQGDTQCRTHYLFLRKRPMHDNAREHTASQPKNRFSTLNFDVFRHLPYSPNMATNTSHFLRSLHSFLTPRKRKPALIVFAVQQTVNFYFSIMHKLKQTFLNQIPCTTSIQVIQLS